MGVTTSKKWWNTDYPNQYYAFPTLTEVGGYPVAGVTNVDIYSSKPEFLGSVSSSQLIPLTRAQYLSINPVNLIIKDGVLSNYVAPATTDTGTSGTASAATSSTATDTTTTSTDTTSTELPTAPAS